MKVKKQFTLYLENKPGELSRVTRRLAAEKINLEGLSSVISSDVGLVQVVVSNAAKTRRVLKQHKIPFTEQDVLILGLKNVPGSLADVVDRAAKRGINISYAYATACECSEACGCYVVISAPDLDKLQRALS